MTDQEIIAAQVTRITSLQDQITEAAIQRMELGVIPWLDSILQDGEVEEAADLEAIRHLVAVARGTLGGR